MHNKEASNIKLVQLTGSVTTATCSASVIKIHEISKKKHCISMMNEIKILSLTYSIVEEPKSGLSAFNRIM